MGMDVFGINPSSEEGEYFRANIWYWRPLWDYIELNFPEIATKVCSPYTNDGDGLDVHASLLLSEKIDHYIDVQHARVYQELFLEGIAKLELETCYMCNGTGSREWPEGTTDEWIQQCNGCNVCNGVGQVRPFAAWYHFDVEVLKEFSVFLRHCGGFQIW